MLANKVVLVTGVANAKSIAWSVSKRLLEEKANLLITYQRPEFRNKIDKLIREECPRENQNAIRLACCDVTKKVDLASLQSFVEEQYGRVDSVFHSIAYAPSSALRNSVVDVSNADFCTTLSISAYSLISLTHALLPLFSSQASVLALSFIGSERFIPHYGVMSIAKAALESTTIQLAGSLGEKGVRVNVLRSSPINTLAARGIPQFLEMKNAFLAKQCCAQTQPLADVSNAAAWLLSDQSRGLTGQVVNVDGGYSVMGVWECLFVNRRMNETT